MSAAQDLLAKAVASIVGKKEERAVASLFTPGGTHAMKGEFQGINDFEVVAFLVVLPEAGGERMNFAPPHQCPGPATGCPRGSAGAQEAAAGTGRAHRRRQATYSRRHRGNVWVAALKPNNIGVPVFRDDVREYLEIAVLTVVLRAAAKPTRLTELIHRAIPYPVVLVAAHGGTVSLSLAHKRWSQGETGKVVIEEVRRTAPFQPDAPRRKKPRFSPAWRWQVCLPATCSRSIRAGSTAWPHWKRPRLPACLSAGICRPLAQHCMTAWSPRPTPARPCCSACPGGEGKATQPPGGIEP